MHAVRRPLGERRDRRPVAGPRPDAAPRRGPAPDQQRRRRLELRDARAGQADPHLRRRRGPRRRRRAPDDRRPPRRRRASGSRRSTTSPASSTPDMLVIADPPGAIGIAGVMGGADSEVWRRRPREVVVESAIFDPVSIRRTAQRLALRSEASQPVREGPGAAAGAASGADRTAQLIREWAGGEIAPGAVDTAPDQPAPARVAFRPARVNRLLGTALAARRAARPARPGRRRDRAGRAPATEVVARPRAASRLGRRRGRRRGARPRSCRPGAGTSRSRPTSPRRSPGSAATSSCRRSRRTPRCPRFRPSPLEVRELVRDTLAGAGLTEVVTTALVSPAPRRDVRAAPARCRRSATSRSPAATRSAWPTRCRATTRSCAGTCSAACSTWSAANLRHGTEDVAVFEIGKGYARTGDEPREWWRLGFALVGAAEPPAWNRSAAPVRPRRRQGRARAARDPARPRPAGLRAGGAARPCSTRAGRARARRRRPPARPRRRAPPVTSSTRGSCGPPTRVIVAEVAHRRAGRGPAGAGTCRRRSARFPEVDRDLAIVVPEATAAAAVEAVVRAHGGDAAARRRAVRHLPRRAARGDEKSLAYRLRLRRRGPDAHRGRDRGGGRRRRRGAARGRGPPPGLTPAWTIARRRSRTGTVRRAAGIHCGARSAAATLRRGHRPTGARPPSHEG